MFKRNLIFAMVAVLALGFVACGDDDESDAGVDAGAEGSESSAIVGVEEIEGF